MVIALTHMRMPNDEILAREVPEIDLILGGNIVKKFIIVFVTWFQSLRNLKTIEILSLKKSIVRFHSPCTLFLRIRDQLFNQIDINLT